MSTIVDKLRIPADLGKAIARHRKDNKLSAVDVAVQAGRSRTVLHKLEKMQRRFAKPDEDGGQTR